MTHLTVPQWTKVLENDLEKWRGVFYFFQLGTPRLLLQATCEVPILPRLGEINVGRSKVTSKIPSEWRVEPHVRRNASAGRTYYKFSETYIKPATRKAERTP